MNLFEIHPKPWSIKPLSGKYHGTTVLDGFGKEIATIWDGATGMPSSREIERLGYAFTEKAWSEHRSDSHYEDVASLEMAQWLVNMSRGDELVDLFRRYVRWHGPVHRRSCSAGSNCDCGWKEAFNLINAALDPSPLSTLKYCTLRDFLNEASRQLNDHHFGQTCAECLRSAVAAVISAAMSKVPKSAAALQPMRSWYYDCERDEVVIEGQVYTRKKA